MFLHLLRVNAAVAAAWVVAILVSLTIHEFSHALIARWRGDRTAEREGRLTLNPLAHLDLFGFIPLLFLGFGWAKPVPFNPYNLRNPKWDSVAVALAGPLSNLLLALIAGLGLRFFLFFSPAGSDFLLVTFLVILILLNLSLLLFNLIPIHPLDGSKLFFAIFDRPHHAALRRFVAENGPRLLLIFVFLSLLTNWNIFFFITVPAAVVCNLFTGLSCYSIVFSLF